MRVEIRAKVRDHPLMGRASLGTAVAPYAARGLAGLRPYASVHGLGG
jgi:hypothetical protein